MGGDDASCEVESPSGTAWPTMCGTLWPTVVVHSRATIDTGCQWRLIPLDFPPSGTVRYYFDKWNDDGTMLEIHDCLRRAVRQQQGREPEPTAVVIDSQSVKTAEAGGERGFDGGKQVDGRKRQLVVDTEGNLLTVTVHAADIQDRDGVQPALIETHELCPSVTYVWADQSYRGDLIEWASKV